ENARSRPRNVLKASDGCVRGCGWASGIANMRVNRKLCSRVERTPRPVKQIRTQPSAVTNVLVPRRSTLSSTPCLTRASSGPASAGIAENSVPLGADARIARGSGAAPAAGLDVDEGPERVGVDGPPAEGRGHGLDVGPGGEAVLDHPPAHRGGQQALGIGLAPLAGLVRCGVAAHGGGDLDVGEAPRAAPR